MHVKTYTGSSTSAVLASIKTDLGPGAVILDTRETKKGGKTEIVITAAVEREGSPRPGNGQGAEPRAAFVPVGADGGGRGWKSWQEEWSSIKNHLLTLLKPELQMSRLAPRQRVVIEFLEREGVDPSSLLEVYEALLSDPRASVLAPLGNLVPVKAWNAKNWPQRVHLIAGPFGAGKTTALVRLALLLRKSLPNSKIWVVNADSRRGGGRLLLKNYAQLCCLEYKEAGNAVDFARILAGARAESVDRIFVDLPGLPRGKNMSEMREFFGMTDPEHALHLVSTPHYGDNEMRILMARYLAEGTVRNASLIWTKLDEASKFGTLVNAGAATHIPVSAFSCGPELNNTLVPAEDTAMWRLLFKQELPCPVQTGNCGF